MKTSTRSLPAVFSDFGRDSVNEDTETFSKDQRSHSKTNPVSFEEMVNNSRQNLTDINESVRSYSVSRNICTTTRETPVFERLPTTAVEHPSVPPPPPPPPPPPNPLLSNTARTTPATHMNSTSDNKRVRYIYAYPEEVPKFLPKTRHNHEKYESADADEYRTISGSRTTIEKKIARDTTQLRKTSESDSVKNVPSSRNSPIQRRDASTPLPNVSYFDKIETLKHENFSSDHSFSADDERTRKKRYDWRQKVTNSTGSQTAEGQIISAVNDGQSLSVSSLVNLFEKELNQSTLKRITNPNRGISYHIGEFVNDYFGNTKQLNVNIVEEKNIPLQHYRQIKANISSGDKSADVHLRQLLTIQPNDAQSLLLGDFRNFEETLTKNGKQKRLRYYGQEESPQLKNKSFLLDEKLKNFDAENCADTDLLLLVHQRILNNLPLDWPELYLIKNAHCRLVAHREKQVHRLKDQSLSLINGSAEKNKTEMVIKRIEQELFQDYINYQALIEKIRLVDNAYTLLALLIMQADSFWYTAKVCSDPIERRNYYSLAKKGFADLLDKSREALPPDDISVLKILEKLTAILAECPDKRDESIRDQCFYAANAAQTALSKNPDPYRLSQMLRNIRECLESCESFY